jgi:hypothetical protein
MASLRELEARLLKTVRVETAEKETEGELAGKFVFRDEKGEKWMWSPRPYRWEFHTVQSPADADHIQFLCPLCFQKNGGAKGTHGVFVSFHGRNAPDECGSRDSKGNPSRWNISGTSLDDLVLTPSILLDAGQPADRGCHWHGFVGSSGVPPGHAA